MASTNQTNRLLLRIVAVTLLLTSAFLIWRAFCDPTLPTVSGNDVASSTLRSSANARLTRELDEFEPILARSLSAPLYDPLKPKPKARPEPEVVNKEPPRKKKGRKDAAGLRVIGTMIEAGQSLAILVGADGEIGAHAVGDAIETADGSGQVEKIELKQVTISIDDETLTLKAPQ